MAWELEIWWGYSNKCSTPALKEEFNTKADGTTRAAEVLSDGYTASSPGEHHFYPASGITHVSLVEITEE
jgi:hypothetical protein